MGIDGSDAPTPPPTTSVPNVNEVVPLPEVGSQPLVSTVSELPLSNEVPTDGTIADSLPVSPVVPESAPITILARETFAQYAARQNCGLDLTIDDGWEIRLLTGGNVHVDYIRDFLESHVRRRRGLLQPDLPPAVVPGDLLDNLCPRTLVDWLVTIPADWNPAWRGIRPRQTPLLLHFSQRWRQELLQLIEFRNTQWHQMTRAIAPYYSLIDMAETMMHESMDGFFPFDTPNLTSGGRGLTPPTTADAHFDRADHTALSERDIELATLGRLIGFIDSQVDVMRDMRSEIFRTGSIALRHSLSFVPAMARVHYLTHGGVDATQGIATPDAPSPEELVRFLAEESLLALHIPVRRPRPAEATEQPDVAFRPYDSDTGRAFPGGPPASIAGLHQHNAGTVIPPVLLLFSS